MAERDYFRYRHRRHQRRRVGMLLMISLLVSGSLALVTSCSQQVEVTDHYEPKDVDRLHMGAAGPTPWHWGGPGYGHDRT